jgi:hypothetical protein
MKISRNFIFYIVCALLFATKFAYGIDDEDDDEIADAIVDLMVGVGLALCQGNATCSGIMSIISIIILTIGLVVWIWEGCKCNCERPSNKQIRSGFRIGGAYGVTRWLRS